MLGAFISNFLSDILWAYSLTFTVFIILGISEKNILPTFIICGIFEISIELAQKTGLITGTFDILDIAFELAISAIALVVIKKFIKRGQKNEKKY